MGLESTDPCGNTRARVFWDLTRQYTNLKSSDEHQIYFAQNQWVSVVTHGQAFVRIESRPRCEHFIPTSP